MAREIRFLKSLLPLLLISVFTANISWAQVNPVASKVTAEEKLFVEYIATIFVEPNDSNGDLVEVDPDDLSVELDDSYSGRVTIGDFEPVVVRRQIVGYAAGMSTNEAQTISGTVELAGSRLPLGAFSTKFQEIGNISSVTTEVSSALADGEDEVLIRVILLDDDRMAIEGVHEEDFELAFKAAGPPQIQSFEEDSDAAGFYYIGITNTESGSGSYELRVAGRFVGSASFTFEEIDPVELVDQTRTIVEATSPHRPDGQDASTITVSLFDANNDPVDGVPENEIWLTYISGGSDFLSFSGFSETSDVGVFEGQLTNSQIATVEVAARINGEDSYDTARIVFQAEPVSASNSEVTATSPHAADGEDASVVTIKLFDESGNPRMITSGMSFNFDISGDASMAGKIRADESGSSQTGSIVGPADSNETELEIVNETEETVTVAVSVFDPNIEEWVLLDDVPEIEFITMPDPELSNITGTSGSAIADGSDEIIITVELLDSSNQPINTVASDEFEIVVGGNATKTSVEKIDGKDGLYEFRLRNNTVETVDVTVFARNISIDSIEVEFEKEPEPDDPVVDASSSSVEATSPHTADGNDASTVTVTVMGDDVNPMTGFSNSDFDIDLTGNASASNVSNEGGGEYEFEVTNSTAQTVTVTVTVDGTELNDTPQIEFREEEPDDPVVDASSSSVEATSPHTADGSDASTVTVTVMGDDGNPMTGFSNSDFDIDLTGNASASNVSNEGGGEYEFEVTNSTVQTVTVTVTVDGTELNDTPQIEFREEEPDDPVVDASSSSVEATSPHDADGSDASTVTINLVDESGDAMENVSSGSFSISLSGSAELASDLSNEGNGEYEVQVTNNTAETVTVTVTVQGIELEETAQIVFEEVDTIVPDPPSITDVIAVDEGVRIEWESSANNVDIFHVYRGASPSDIELLTEIPGSSNSFTDSDIPDQSNFYAVTAVNAAGEESASTDPVNFFDGLILSNDSWQMVSKPLNGTVQLGSTITAFSFSDRYEVAESLNGADGYWMKSNDDSSIEIEIRGEGVLETSISLNEGWNMIGGIAYSLPVAEIGDPSGVLTQAPVYHFDNGEYSEADELEPGKGYWLHAEEAGTIELNLHEALASASTDLYSVHQLIDGGQEELPALTVESADGRSQKLYLSREELPRRERYRYILPPKAPEIGLDVRSASGYKVLQAAGDSFTIEASEYPVNIRLSDQHGSEEYQLILREGNREEVVMIGGFRSHDLNYPVDVIEIQKVSETTESITEHKLLPSYPNPFNPATTIEYQIGENTHVTLEVFDASGRRVHVLANENQSTGQYRTKFEASNLASGMYMVRLRAGNQVQVQKISLIK